MAVTETGHAAARDLDDLYRRHGAHVYRYALAVLGNHADAEDVTQTTFLSAYGALEQGVRPRKPENWLLTIASNAIKQRFRQESARPRQVLLDDDIADTSPSEEGPTVGELLAALAKIPPQQRQAIVLREFEGRSYAEIADILSVTHSALETLLFRARKSLAEELEHQLTCTEAQLAISKAADERLGRKERRRLREHLGECPDCSRFARLQQRHRRALKGLVLVPVPVSLSLFRGLEGTAAAATLPAAAAATGVTATVGTGAAVVGTGAGATGGGLFAGGLAIKAAAVASAAAVTGGIGLTGASEIAPLVRDGGGPPPHAKSLSPDSPGKKVGLVAPRGASGKGNGVAAGKPRSGETGRSSKPSAASGKRAARSGGTRATRSQKAKPTVAAKRPASASAARTTKTAKPKATPTGLKPAQSNRPAASTRTMERTGSGKLESGAPSSNAAVGTQAGKPEK